MTYIAFICYLCQPQRILQCRRFPILAEVRARTEVPLKVNHGQVYPLCRPNRPVRIRPSSSRNQIVNDRPVSGSSKGTLNGDLWVCAAAMRNVWDRLLQVIHISAGGRLLLTEPVIRMSRTGCSATRPLLRTGKRYESAEIAAGRNFIVRLLNNHAIVLPGMRKVFLTSMHHDATRDVVCQIVPLENAARIDLQSARRRSR